MTIAAWYQRLNQRERILSAIVAGVVFLLLNWIVWSKLLGSLEQARAELAARRDTRKVQEVFIRERALWEKLAKWLTEHQPTLKGPGEASTLLDEIKQIAGKHNVVIENPAIGTSDATPERQAGFRFLRSEEPVASAGSISLRRPAAGIVRGLRKHHAQYRPGRSHGDARQDEGRALVCARWK